MKPLVPSALLDQAADRFRLLGEPVRLELLSLLYHHGELNVQGLVQATGQHQANVSKHLGLLVREGLVRRRQQGHFAYYSVADPTLPGLCLLVCTQIRDGQAARLAGSAGALRVPPAAGAKAS